jgi:hypothetical protein
MNPKDQEIADALLKSSRELFAANDTLIQVLLREEPRLTQAFVIHWIPDQGEDFYTVVLNPRTILSVEIPREVSDAMGPVVERISHKSYSKRKLAKNIRRKLNVAVALLKKLEQDASVESE